MTYQDVIDLALSACGRDDEVTQKYAKRGVNFGVTSAALLFTPPELEIANSVEVVAGTTHTGLNILSEVRNLKILYNATECVRIWFMPKEKFDVLTGSLSSGVIEFCARHGNTLYYSDIPSQDTIIHMLYDKYPPVVTDMSLPLPFINYDEFVLEEATKFIFACFEEGDSIDTLNKVTNQLIMSLTEDKKIRDEFEVTSGE